MKVRIKFNARQAAETLLRDVLHRRNFTVDTRDALADHLEAMVLREFATVGVIATNDHEN